jgi:CRP-like cAMP-binding protein
MSAALSPADLSRLAVLQGADEQVLSDAARMMKSSRAMAGEVLGREGDDGGSFWLVLEGRAQVSRATRSGIQILAEAGPGSILGELSVLRRQPRTATVTALTDCRLATGDAAVLDLFLSDQTVRNRLRRLASSRLARDLRPVKAVLSDGTPIVIRPLLPEDRKAFDEEIHRLSRESLRRRFFSAGGPSPALIDYLVDIDFVDHFAWVAIDVSGSGEGMATARYIRSDVTPEAEMAFGTADRYQGRGLATFLLGALGVAANEAGIERLVAHVLEDNLAMRAVFSKAQARTVFDEPGVVYVELDPAAAAGLLPPDLRRSLASAVHDIVTAASLALAPAPPPQA